MPIVSQGVEAIHAQWLTMADSGSLSTLFALGEQKVSTNYLCRAEVFASHFRCLLRELRATALLWQQERHFAGFCRVVAFLVIHTYIDNDYIQGYIQAVSSCCEFQAMDQ